jgi:hypothetical protein
MLSPLFYSVPPLSLSLPYSSSSLRAIEHYERSETARVEIPRMLFSLGKMDVLEDYVHKSSDDTLLKVSHHTHTRTLTHNPISRHARDAV